MFKKSVNKLFLLIIFVLFISVNYHFFINTYNLLKNSYSKRMVDTYGDCSREGYGFSKFIFDKYQPKHNIVFFNGKSDLFTTTSGFFYNKNLSQSDNLIILINYEKDISKNFENYKIVEKKNNCFLIQKNND